MSHDHLVPQRASINEATEVATSVEAAESVAFSAFGRVVTTIPLPHKPIAGKPEFEYREHGYIGDAITLTFADGTKSVTGDRPFHLDNGLQLTYGQINGLAGDLYGTYDPICLGKSPAEQQQRFQDAFHWLAHDTTRQPAECLRILTVLKMEVEAVNLALQLHKDPSIVYASIVSGLSLSLNAATGGRTVIPTYLGLAKINFDHFGKDARTAYDAGHSVALQAAVEGKLEYAYTLNAFADHFLEDSFAAGHMRTPRHMLHSSIGAADMCSKYMHDEDNAIGLVVKNPAGESWTAYGDKRALDRANAENLRRCLHAVQISSDEIYAAYRTKTLPNTFKAWDEAPTLESANDSQTLAALFMEPNLRRVELHDRRKKQYTSLRVFGPTLIELTNSPWWKYPIAINGPQHIVPWTGIAACSTGRYLQTMVLYVNPDHGIRMSQVTEAPGGEYKWAGGPTSKSLATGSFFGSMASICWQGTDHAVYTLDGYAFYLDKTFTVRDVHHLAGRWSSGTISSLKIKMDWFGSMAATSWYDTLTRQYHIRVYLQEAGKTQIQEFCWQSSNKKWGRGATLCDAAKGTGLAAAAQVTPGTGSVEVIHVFYQASDGIIQDFFWDATQGWRLNTDVEWAAAPSTGIAVAPPCLNSQALNVFYVGNSPDGTLCQRTSTKDWKLNEQKLPIPRMTNVLAAIMTTDPGASIRVYYQGAESQIVELMQAENEITWTASIVATPWG